MNVSLTPELERLVREKVASGRYHSASEVVREGLRLLEERERPRARRFRRLRREIQEGLGQARRGELVDARTAIRDARAAIERHRRRTRRSR